MSRSTPIYQDWPESLKDLSLDALRKLLAKHRTIAKFVGHPTSKKRAARDVRDIEKEIASRESA